MGELREVGANEIENYFYDLPGTSDSRNRYIHVASQKNSLRISNIPEIFSRFGLHLQSSSYIYPGIVDSVLACSAVHVYRYSGY